MHPSSIKSMDQLQQAQDRLQRQMQLTKKEFFNSANTTSGLSTEFLVKKVLLPVGAIGLGAFVANKIFSRPSPTESVEYDHGGASAHIAQNNSNPWFSKLMLVALPLVQQYFLKADTGEKVRETADAGKTEAAYAVADNGASPMGILSKVIPMVIPILQQHFASNVQNEEEYVMENRLSADGEVMEVPVRKTTTSPLFSWLYKLMPVVLPLIQQHFLTQKVEEKKAEGNPTYVGNYETASSY